MVWVEDLPEADPARPKTSKSDTEYLINAWNNIQVYPRKKVNTGIKRPDEIRQHL
jgi:hypothetical protein